jgi:hypothetical protein
MATVSKSRPCVKPAFAASLAVTINGQAYQASPIEPGGFGTKAFRLAGEQGQVYDVIRTHFGLVECDCPHYEMRLKGNCCDCCKHGAALVALGLLEAPEPVEPARDAWEAFDGFTVELGPDPADRDWYDAQDRDDAGDDFPMPRAGATQPSPTPMDETSPEAHRLG